MSPSGTKSLAKKALIPPKRLFSRLRDTYTFQDGGEEREPLIAGGSALLPSPRRPTSLRKLEVKSLSTSDVDGIILSKQYAQMVQEILPYLPPHYPLLDPHDVKFTGEHLVSAGGFADIWEAIHAGRKVVLKSYRCYMSFDVARAVTVRSAHQCQSRS